MDTAECPADQAADAVAAADLAGADVRSVATRSRFDISDEERANLIAAVRAGELELSEIVDEQLRTFIGFQVNRAAASARARRLAQAEEARARVRRRRELNAADPRWLAIVAAGPSTGRHARAAARALAHRGGRSHRPPPRSRFSRIRRGRTCSRARAPSRAGPSDPEPAGRRRLHTRRPNRRHR